MLLSVPFYGYITIHLLPVGGYLGCFQFGASYIKLQ